MLDQDFIYTLLLTGKLALITTVILILIGIPVAYWLSYSRFKLKFIAETLISMPMVLPPTVMGLSFGRLQSGKCFREFSSKIL
jgi:molybdate transport system permease protein